MLQLKSRPTLWTDLVQNAWKLPEEITVSQWADKNRILDPMTSAESGQWYTDRTPYLRGIMDSFINPLVEKITLMMSTQVGKTESLLNMLGYAIDQDPGPALMVYPREPDAKTMSSTRIKPMIDLSPALRRHCTKESDDLTKMQMKLDRMYIYFAGANSPAALSGKPVRYLFRDEVDKYPKWAGEEADPLKLSQERTRTYIFRKIIDCSTPTTEDGYIYREYNLSDQRAYYVPCPHCGGYQVLTKDQIKVPPEERDTKRIRLNRIAWYECVYCANKITDLMKQNMLQNGLWLPASIKVNSKGELSEKMVFPETSHAGFFLNALYSPWLSFSEIIAEFFDSHDRPELLMNFINSWLAQIWQEKVAESRPEQIRKLCCEYEKATVPDGGIILVGAVDVQLNYFVCSIRAFGPHPESWLILEEVVKSWEDVEKIMLNTRYASVITGIDPFEVALTLIDTGYRTNEVYDFCRQHRDRTRAIKGKDQLGGVPFKTTTLDKYTNGKPIPNGLLLYLLNTTYFKDKIARLIDPEDKVSKWHLFKNPSDNYINWLCGEHKVRERDKKKSLIREVWRKVRTHAQTHSWDTEVYAAAGAEMLYTYNLRIEDKPKPKIEMVPAQDLDRAESWIPRKRGWIKNG